MAQHQGKRVDQLLQPLGRQQKAKGADDRAEMLEAQEAADDRLIERRPIDDAGRDDHDIVDNAE